MKLKIIGVATEENQQSKALVAQLEERGFDVTILGIGEEWTGFEQKIRLVKNFCLKFVDDRTEKTVVIVTDCYDVLTNRHDFTPQDVVNAFLKFKADIVIGAESSCLLNCYKDVAEITKTQAEGSPNLYPNGGFVCGFAEYVGSYYEALHQIFPDDDQLAAGMLIESIAKENHGKPIVKLDYHSRLVHNYVFQDLEIKDEKFKTKNGSQVPFFVHCPNVHLDYGKRYNRVADEKIIDAGVFGFLGHVGKHFTNPVYLQVWLPIVVFLIMLVLVAYFLYKYTQCKKTCKK